MAKIACILFLLAWLFAFAAVGTDYKEVAVWGFIGCNVLGFITFMAALATGKQADENDPRP